MLAAGAHGAIKMDFSLYTACTRVQTVSLDPYSCDTASSPEMTSSIYTRHTGVDLHPLNESTRTAVSGYTPHHYYSTDDRCTPSTPDRLQLCVHTHVPSIGSVFAQHREVDGARTEGVL